MNTRKITNNVYVGPAYATSEMAWDVIINVNDTFPARPIQTFSGDATDAPGFMRCFWVPVDEVTFWGYTPFFAVKRILDHYAVGVNKILVHCASGIHRSPTVVYAWMMSRGIDDQTAVKCLGQSTIDAYCRDVRENKIPNDLPVFFGIMDAHPDWGLAMVLSDLSATRRVKTSPSGF